MASSCTEVTRGAPTPSAADTYRVLAPDLDSQQLWAERDRRDAVRVRGLTAAVDTGNAGYVGLRSGKVGLSRAHPRGRYRPRKRCTQPISDSDCGPDRRARPRSEPA